MHSSSPAKGMLSQSGTSPPAPDREARFQIPIRSIPSIRSAPKPNEIFFANMILSKLFLSLQDLLKDGTGG